MWLWLDTGYACGGVRLDDYVVVEAAPIFRWMIGKDIAEVMAWPRIKEAVWLKKCT